MIHRVRRDSLCLEKVRLAAKDQAYGNAADNKALTLRGRRLSSPECPPEELCTDIRPYGEVFTALDISYTPDCSWDTVEAFCQSLPHLENLSAQCCNLPDPVKVPQWPKRLKNLNLARNHLTQCPPGLDTLPALQVINLSGNCIESLAQDVLKLSELTKLYLTGNPLVYPPKSVAQQGVEAVRLYCGVAPVLSVHSALSVTDGGYDSAVHCPETSQDGSTVMDTTCSEGEEEEEEGSRNNEDNSEREEDSEVERDLMHNCAGGTPLHFSPDVLPPLYSWVTTEHSCQVYLPHGHDLTEVQVHSVQDHSLLPSLQPNEILATPIVSVQPHGMRFPPYSPAVLVIPHCIDPSVLSGAQLVPFCSNTSSRQSPEWKKLDNSTVEIFSNCIKLTTVHFSLFAVLLHWPYPSATAEADPQRGGRVTVPEVPGLSVELPPGAVQEPISLKTVVYFGDEPYHVCSGAALASACIGLEPHGQQFNKPVEICVPIPDGGLICEEFGGRLSLWHAEYGEEGAPLHWEQEDVLYELQEVEPGLHVVHFSVTHFSWYKWMWDLPQAVLRAARAGAVHVFQHMRLRAISVRCQVLMSPPIHDRTCGMAVAVFRFGEPLRSIANYKWILADSGERRRYLRTGTVEVVLTGLFQPISEFEENELKDTVIFTGQDFCLEFALKLKETVELPLHDHQVIGKLVLKEITGQSGRAVISVNLIKPAEEAPGSLRPIQSAFPGVITETPPPTPEQQGLGSPQPSASGSLQWDRHSDTGHSSTSDLPSATEWDATANVTPRHTGFKRRAADANPFAAAHHPSAKRKHKLKRIPRTGSIGDDRFLLNISRDINNRWQELGIELGLSHSALQSIPVDHSSGVHMCAYIMLQEWKRQSPDATYHQLKEALEKINLHECIHKHFLQTPAEQIRKGTAQTRTVTFSNRFLHFCFCNFS